MKPHHARTKKTSRRKHEGNLKFSDNADHQFVDILFTKNNICLIIFGIFVIVVSILNDKFANFCSKKAEYLV